MNQTRRTILMGSSALPLALALPGCGGGEGDPSAPKGGLAHAQAVKPAAGPYAEFVAAAPSTLDPVFISSGTTQDPLRYFVARSSSEATQALVSPKPGGAKDAVVTMFEVVESADRTIVHRRSIMLTLPSLPPAGSSKTYDPRSTAAANRYKGSVTVNRDAPGTPVDHYEYELSGGGVRVTHVRSGLLNVEFISYGGTDVKGSVATQQAFPDGSSLGLLAGSNKAQRAFLLKTYAGTAIPVAYREESCSWI